ncbi:uncharacterized protein CBL_05736 [Carabus blaptoides fortunei]
MRNTQLTIQAVILLALLDSTLTDHTADYGNYAQEYSYPEYSFSYGVKDPHTGDEKQQWEKRKGDHVEGSYSLVEPDGSTRVVDYTVDGKHGFSAIVKNTGVHQHSADVQMEIQKFIHITNIKRLPETMNSCPKNTTITMNQHI